METLQVNVDNKHRNAESLQAVEDARSHRNLHGPYKSAEEAVRAILINPVKQSS